MGIPSNLRESLKNSGFDEQGNPLADQAEQVTSTDAVVESATQNSDEQSIQQEQVSSAEQGEAANVEIQSTDHDAQSADVVDAPDANYKRMEGRYKAQISRLEASIKELTEQARGNTVLADLLADTRRELSELKVGGVKALTETEQQASQIPELTAEELEIYGDFTPVAQKLIAQANAPLLKKIAELQGETGKVNEQVHRNAEADFVGKVHSKVEGFNDIIQSPEWLEYLNRNVPFTNLTLKDALQDAHSSRDLERVTGIFNAFSQEHARASIIANKATPDQEKTPASEKPAANGLAKFATPEPTTANPPNKSTSLFKQADYRAAMDRMRSGQMTKEAFVEFEDKFNAAERQGRVAT